MMNSKIVALGVTLVTAATVTAQFSPSAFAAPKSAQDLRTLARTSSLAGPAAERPEASTNRADALRRAALMRSLARHQGQLDSRLAPPASPVGLASAPIVRDARAQVADDGFNWADCAIGGGVTAALLLGAAGVASVRRHPAMTTH